MEALGYLLAVIVAVAIAAAGYQVLNGRIAFDRNMLALVGLGFLGTWGGSRLFRHGPTSWTRLSAGRTRSSGSCRSSRAGPRTTPL